MSEATHRKVRHGRRTQWTSAVIIALCAAGAAAALAAFLLLRSANTGTGPPEPGTGAAVNATVSVGGSTCSGGQSFYAAPAGKPGNSGSLDAPLDLAYALSAKGPAKPCDTIWLREGTYKGAFKSELKGEENRPIIVRRYPGERATLDSAGLPDSTLQVGGAWTWYWGFEIMNSDPQRSSKEPGPWPSDLRRGSGVGSRGTHLKFINLVVHDAARGFEVNADSAGTELYGNLIYFNGWETPGGGAQGNGIETQNVGGSRRIADNVIFHQFSHGIIVSGKPLDNVILDGNTIFSNGSISRKGVMESRNVLLGAGMVANKPVVTNNAIYDGQTNLGYDAGCANATVRGNYFAGPLIWVKCEGEMQDNVVYDPYVTASGYGALSTRFPSNTYHTSRPTGVVVRIRPNEYEPGRATLTIFNWDRKSSVGVNLAEAGLVAGDRFEVRDVQNYFGKPAAEGVYQGGSIDLPMETTEIATPVGSVPAAPKHTPAEMGAFVVLRAEAKSGT